MQGSAANVLMAADAMEVTLIEFATGATSLSIANLFGMPIGGVAAIAIMVVIVLLWIYSSRHASKRRQQLDALMPSLGYEPIVDPSADDLLPTHLLHVNGFESTRQSGHGDWKNFHQPRVLAAWAGQMQGHGVTVLDVSISRRLVQAGQRKETTRQLNATTVRCELGSTAKPPDLLIREWVLFKQQMKGQRTVRGTEQFGEHYFLFSDAPQAELESWLPPGFLDQLARHRQWEIAVHDGVVFLTRKSWESAADMPAFLEEAAALIVSLLTSRSA